MMNIEIAAICFVISAVSKKNRLGIGISVAMLLYVYDLMARVVPDLKDAIFISPFPIQMRHQFLLENQGIVLL